MEKKGLIVYFNKWEKKEDWDDPTILIFLKKQFICIVY